MPVTPVMRTRIVISMFLCHLLQCLCDPLSSINTSQPTNLIEVLIKTQQNGDTLLAADQRHQGIVEISSPAELRTRPTTSP